MGLILNIETATKNCSVALADGNNILAQKEIYSDKYSHSETLHLYIEEVLKEASKSLEDLSAVAVSKGPGSYTGLRIGVSTAKGLCYALDIPLIAMDTLEILAEANTDKQATVVPMIDARRMEVYTAIYDSDKKKIEEISAKIIEEDSYANIEGKVVFLGDGAEKCKEILNRENYTFLEGVHPAAKYMVDLSNTKFQNKHFENLAYFEPFYLKDFIALKPKKIF